MPILAAPSETTISDIEKTVQDGLEALRDAPLNDQITAALKFLTPPGYRPIAQLEEDGRKKRSTAAASNWNPATCEIVIYFEPIPLSRSINSSDGEDVSFGSSSTQSGMQVTPDVQLPHSIPRPNRDLSVTGSHVVKRSVSIGKPSESQDPPLARTEVSSLELQQCCEVLAESEKAGKSFIALKWFRDTALVASGHQWAESLSYRQAVVTKAIEAGALITSTIPNPKAPQYPTTTVKLNRESEYAKTVTRRFQPIRPRGGESASEIILRDRGRL
jgi:hypothetical protein